MWLQLKIATTAEHVQLISEALHAAGAQAVTLQDSADQPLYEPAPGATPLWHQTTVMGLFADNSDINQIIQQLQKSCGVELLTDWQVEKLGDQKWEMAWMENFHAMRFGTHLWICPSWESVTDPDAIVINLDPGLAFGTGTHVTTALCLEWLDEHFISNKQVIDYGCGSGILSIAAVKLGAQHVWAVDNDPQAIQATQENAEKNSVTDRLSICLPDALPVLEADILIANILANPLLELASHFALLVRTGGYIVLSGILAEQQQSVLQAYQPWFDIKSIKQSQDWLRLEGTRKAGV
jgi:ribosomal protein L11 methyltransferase